MKTDSDRVESARRAASEPAPASDAVETFPNPSPARDYEIEITAPEWTAVCPITGQPDFATIRVTYVPDEKCLELKSFKLYMQSFRNRGVFHEAVTNEILDHLVDCCRPRRMRVMGDFNVRGGIHTAVTAEYPKMGVFDA